MAIHPFEAPIQRRILDHTGRVDGDDSGYRDVAVCPFDVTAPDALVEVAPQVLRHLVYASGPFSGITPYYEGGLGATNVALLRAPASAAIAEADSRLSEIGRRLMLLDAFRPATVQASLFRALLERRVGESGRSLDTLSANEWISFGRLADETASYAPIVRQQHAEDRARHLALQRDVVVAAESRGIGTIAVSWELLTYRTNAGVEQCPLDETGNTAHGSGGAADLWLLSEAGHPANLGAPFDYTGSVATIDWFESNGPLEFRREVERSPDLQAYLQAFGVQPDMIERRLCEAIALERRILFNCMRSVGATFYSMDGNGGGEFWHFNLGNERGGNQVSRLPGAGNGCHSLLRNVRDPATGSWMAVWGNESAHRLAREFVASHNATGRTSQTMSWGHD